MMGRGCMHKACLPEGLRGTSKYLQIFPNIGTSKYFQSLWWRQIEAASWINDHWTEANLTKMRGWFPCFFFNSGWDYQIVEFTRAVWKMVLIHDQIITIWLWSNFVTLTNLIKRMWSKISRVEKSSKMSRVEKSYLPVSSKSLPALLSSIWSHLLQQRNIFHV